MPKIRDFDAELKALGERAKLLKQRKVQQYGDLVEATGADALDPELLAGALLAAVATTDKGITADWSKRGAEFFRGRERKRSNRNPANTAVSAASGTEAHPDCAGTIAVRQPGVGGGTEPRHPKSKPARRARR